MRTRTVLFSFTVGRRLGWPQNSEAERTKAAHAASKHPVPRAAPSLRRCRRPLTSRRLSPLPLTRAHSAVTCTYSARRSDWANGLYCTVVSTVLYVVHSMAYASDSPVTKWSHSSASVLCGPLARGTQETQPVQLHVFNVDLSLRASLWRRGNGRATWLTRNWFSRGVHRRTREHRVWLYKCRKLYN